MNHENQEIMPNKETGQNEAIGLGETNEQQMILEKNPANLFQKNESTKTLNIWLISIEQMIFSLVKLFVSCLVKIFLWYVMIILFFMDIYFEYLTAYLISIPEPDPNRKYIFPNSFGRRRTSSRRAPRRRMFGRIYCVLFRIK